MIKGFIHTNADMSIERYVTIHGNVLLPGESQAVINHSPDGFNWGYGGSGASQLALAILLRFTRKEEAVRYHQPFKWQFIARLPQNKEWELPDGHVTAWLDAIRKRNKGGKNL